MNRFHEQSVPLSQGIHNEVQAPMGLPPWHMWGTTATVQGVSAGVLVQSPQLARINYGRPECWRFITHVLLPQGTPVGASITINFKCVVGIGRSSLTMSPLTQFTAGASLAPNASSWQTRSFQPNFDGTISNTNPDDALVAQDINAWAEITANAQAVGIPITVTAMFAPNVHVRSGWFRGVFEENYEE